MRASVYTPAKIMPARIIASTPGPVSEFIQAPMNAKKSRQRSQGGSRPVDAAAALEHYGAGDAGKANVNSAVAIAAWIDSPANALMPGISSMPPIPTAPISVPTAKAVQQQ